jgi:hypothetical protein
LYLSVLLPDQPPDTFAAISRQSRVRNPVLGIRGALLFDGQRFCQLVEGPVEAVQALARRIASDPRHGSMRVLCEDFVPESALSRAWTTGYCDPDDLDALDSAEAPSGESAVIVFRRLLARADLSP